MRKRLLSALVAFCMALTLMPSWALADEVSTPGPPEGAESTVAEPAEGKEDKGEDNGSGTPTDPQPFQEITVEGEAVPLAFPDTLEDSGQLAADFLSMVFPGVFGAEEDGLSVMADLGTSENSPLDAVQQALYRLLRADIEAVAMGERTSTQFTYNTNVSAWSGLLNGFLSGATQEDKDATSASIQEIINCLTVDLPWALYWSDRSAVSYAPSISAEADSSGNIRPGSERIAGVTFYFGADKNYRSMGAAPDSEGRYLTVDQSLINTAGGALDNAAAIVAKYQDESDYKKLTGYLKEICDLVVYNNDAAGSVGGTTSSYKDGENPWQLIWVFDEYGQNTQTTNVVCEGYAKAFQYLCDLTEWTDSSIESHIVSGTMGGGIGSGPHMWNIVTIGSSHYLVDVTNCDGDSIGNPDRLFLCGVSGDASRYSVTFDSQNSIWYTYDTRTTGLYGDTGILNLSSEAYTPPKEVKGTVTIAAFQENDTQLSVSIKDVTIDGVTVSNLTYQYQWYRGNQAISGATGEQYTLPANFRGYDYSVTVTVVQDGEAVGTLNSNVVTIPVLEPVTPNAPAAPAAAAVSSTTIQVTNPNPAYEYAYSTSRTAPAADSSVWTSGETVSFTGLRANTSYYVFARVKAEGINPASAASTGTQVRTPAAPATEIGQFTYTLPQTVTYNGEAQPVAVTSPTHQGHFKVLYNNSETPPTDAGAYTVTVAVEAHDGYPARTFTLGRLTISKATPVIEIPGGLQVSIGGSALTLTCTIQDGIPGSVRWTRRNGTGSATLSGDQLTGTKAGSVTVTAAFTPTDTQNYNGATASATVEVTNKTPQDLAFTEGAPVWALGKGPFTNDLIKGVNIPSTDRHTFTSSDRSIATVSADGTVTVLKKGTVTITLEAKGDDTYADLTISYTLTVMPEEIAPTAEVADTVYGAGAPTVTVKNGDDPLSKADYILEWLADGEYTTEWPENFAATTAEAPAKVRISPNTETGNYYWTAIEREFQVAKAAAPAIPSEKTRTSEHYYAAEGTQTVSIASMFTNRYEVINAVPGTVGGTNPGIVDGTPAFAAGALSFRLKDGQEGDTATIPVTISFRNHEDVAFDVIIKLVDLPKPLAPKDVSMGHEQKGEAEQSVYVNATVQNHPQITAEQTLEFQFTVDGAEGAWQAENFIVVSPAVSVSAKVRVKALQNSHLASDTVTLPNIITPPTIIPNGGSFSGSKQISLSPASTEFVKILYTTDGTEPRYEADGTSSGTEYLEPFTISKTTTVKAVVFILDSDSGAVTGQSDVQAVTITKRSSGSSGGSSSGSGIILTPNGSTSSPSAAATPSTPSTPGVSSGSGATTAAPTATVADGTASAVVSGTIGKELVDQAVANGSETIIISPSIPSTAGKTEVTIGSSVIGDIASRTDAGLQVETPAADVTISNRGLSGLAERGGSVVVSTSAQGNTIEVSVTAGGSRVERVTGGMTVNIPANCTYGTVAMLTRADGSTELVRKSVANASSGTVTVPLEGSATITLVDNSKSFRDVPAGNTFANAVAFVSSREIMNGTGVDTFTPNAPLTRAQLAKILHNLESSPSATVSGSFSDIPADFWSAEAIQWASDKGIVTGYADGSFRPNAYITREQLAVMLYRYAGSPSIGSSDLRYSFNDSDQIGGYAQSAMAWATQNRIINGSGNNLLNPKGQATRAQAAQMLFNYMNYAG